MSRAVNCMVCTMAMLLLALSLADLGITLFWDYYFIAGPLMMIIASVLLVLAWATRETFAYVAYWVLNTFNIVLNLLLGLAFVLALVLVHRPPLEPAQDFEKAAHQWACDLVKERELLVLISACLKLAFFVVLNMMFCLSAVCFEFYNTSGSYEYEQRVVYINPSYN